MSPLLKSVYRFCPPLLYQLGVTALQRQAYPFLDLFSMETSTAKCGQEGAMGSEFLFTGSCFCKAISFTLSASPIRPYICHCLDCRRFSASSFAYNASFPRSALTLIFTSPLDTAGKEQGDETHDSAESQPLAKHGASILSTFGNETTGMQKFCSICGTRLLLYCGSSNVDMRDQVVVPVGAIDGSEKDERLRPVAEGWCKRREGWMPDMKGTEVFDMW